MRWYKIAISEFIDPGYLKDRLDKFTWEAENLKVEIFGGTLVASSIAELKSGTVDVTKTVQTLEDLKGGTLDVVSALGDVEKFSGTVNVTPDPRSRDWTITEVVDIAQASGLKIGATLAVDNVGLFKSGENIGTVGDIDKLSGTVNVTPDPRTRSWTITETVDIAQASGLKIGATIATDKVGLFRQGGTVGQVTAIQNALPAGTNRLGGVRLLDGSDVGFDSLSQDVGGAVQNTLTTVPSGSPGDFTRQPIHDRVTAGTAVSSISYTNAVKMMKATNKGGNDAILQLNSSTGGTIRVDENEGRRIIWNGISTLYYKTPSTPPGTIDVEAWS